MIDPRSLNDPAVAEALLRGSLAETNKEIGEVEAALPLPPCNATGKMES